MPSRIIPAVYLGVIDREVDMGRKAPGTSHRESINLKRLGKIFPNDGVARKRFEVKIRFPCRHNIREVDTTNRIGTIARQGVGRRLRYVDSVA